MANSSAQRREMKDWLADLRRQGQERFAASGLPAPKSERWKFTNLAPAVKDMPQELATTRIGVQGGDKFVHNLEDIYAAGAPEWLIDMQMAEPPAADWPLWHMANAHLRDGLMIDVPAGKRVDKPVEITIQGHDNTWFIPRTALRLGEGSALTVIEYHKGEGRYWNNRLTQAYVGSGAVLRHVRIQENSPQAVYTQNTHVSVDKGGRYEALVLTAGSILSRNEVHVDLIAPEASCGLSGVNLLEGTQHGDTTLTVVHHARDCRSDQFYRSLVRGQARGVFQGRIRVNKGADGTDATQLSNAILMSEGAEMDTKPELEIYTDDVKCSHGATTGALHEEALFYMRSRGLGEEEARAVLLSAFVAEVVEKIGAEDLQETIKGKIRAWLGT